MQSHFSWRRRATLTLLLASTLTLPTVALAAGSAYLVHNLVSDGSVPADHVDTHLVNPWGVAFGGGPVWVSNNHSGTSTLYNGAGVPQALVVTVPPAPGGDPVGSPTGIVASSSNDFVVTKGSKSGPSRFIYCSEDGTISGWSPTADGVNAIIAVVNPGSNYKGLALATKADGNFLYAADFVNGKIDMFDKNFAPVASAGGFSDPTLPSRYAPFNIQALDGLLYVAYAKRDKGGQDEQAGKGLGYVNVFDADGHLLKHLVAHKNLNAPWGLAIAPAGFGSMAGMLLVGNFGDGTIAAFDATTGKSRGKLKGSNGKTLKIDGLWGMAFGNGLSGQDKNTLYFAAGPAGETGGVYGSVSLVAAEAGVGQ